MLFIWFKSSRLPKTLLTSQKVKWSRTSIKFHYRLIYYQTHNRRLPFCILAPPTWLRTFLESHFFSFYTNRPSFHTKLMTPLTETASSLSRCLKCLFSFIIFDRTDLRIREDDWNQLFSNSILITIKSVRFPPPRLV